MQQTQGLTCCPMLSTAPAEGEIFSLVRCGNFRVNGEAEQSWAMSWMSSQGTKGKQFPRLDTGQSHWLIGLWTQASCQGSIQKEKQKSPLLLSVWLIRSIFPSSISVGIATLFAELLSKAINDGIKHHLFYGQTSPFESPNKSNLVNRF